MNPSDENEEEFIPYPTEVNEAAFRETEDRPIQALRALGWTVADKVKGDRGVWKAMSPWGTVYYIDVKARTLQNGKSPYIAIEGDSVYRATRRNAQTLFIDHETLRCASVPNINRALGVRGHSFIGCCRDDYQRILRTRCQVELGKCQRTRPASGSGDAYFKVLRRSWHPLSSLRSLIEGPLIGTPDPIWDETRLVKEST